MSSAPRKSGEGSTIPPSDEAESAPGVTAAGYDRMYTADNSLVENQNEDSEGERGGTPPMST